MNHETIRALRLYARVNDRRGLYVVAHEQRRDAAILEAQLPREVSAMSKPRWQRLSLEDYVTLLLCGAALGFILGWIVGDVLVAAGAL